MNFVELIQKIKKESSLTLDEIKIADELIEKLKSEQSLSKAAKLISTCKDSIIVINKLIEIILKFFKDSS